jgi:hypothetical protein
VVGWDGRVIDKLWLPVTPAADAMNRAIRDIKANWKVHRDEFLGRNP